MANFMGVTASNGAKIKKDKLKELKAYLAKFYANSEDGDMLYIEEEESEPTFYISGYDWLSIYKMNEDDPEPNFDEDVTDEFLQGLAPFLEEALIVESIGNEKCRYPLSAWEWKINPDGKVETNGFKF